MIWAALTLGIIAVIASLICTVAVTVLVSRALKDAFSSLDQIVQRNHLHEDKLLDRLVTIRWEDYAALRSTLEVEEEGGFIPPEEEGGQEAKNILGVPISLSYTPPSDEELLDEDFDEAGEVRR